ncbi:MAG: DUF853 family protein [Planctomycetota bacterium]|nr:MAG: DUF853 family protein [Planctomycetota bacterium]
MSIYFGHTSEREVRLPLEIFARHLVCLGASGSGKTVACKVICEEFIRNDIPVIAVDPQGDIASLALSGSVEEAERRGIAPELWEEFHRKREVYLWTPASSAGIPLGLNPLGELRNSSAYEEFLRHISLTAESIATLLGFDPSTEEGALYSALLNIALTFGVRENISFSQISDLANFFSSPSKSFLKEAEPIASFKNITQLGKKLHLLTIGAKQLIFQLGRPLSIEALLGKEENRPSSKTRLSVIYLNTLYTQEEKDFFLARLAGELYFWMLHHPSDSIQVLFYIDEVAPFLPPVRKPSCKDALKMLLKQGRKYGVSCLLASQNPADIDYTALSQCSSWCLGRMVSHQDIKKVQLILKSLSSDLCAGLVEKMPALAPGQFLFFCPDHFQTVEKVQVRWLFTPHTTLDKEQIQKLVPEEIRRSYLQVSPPSLVSLAKPPESGEAEVGEESDDSLLVIVEEEPVSQKILEFLELSPRCYTLAELAESVGCSLSTARKHIQNLEEVCKRRSGRTYYYWHQNYNLLPEYGLLEPVEVAKLRLREMDLLPLAERYLERKLVFFETEKVEGMELEHFPLWKVHFSEEVRRSFLFFKAKSARQENIYLDPYRAFLAVYSPRQGIEFLSIPSKNPSAILDLDDLCTFEHRMPGELYVNWSHWKQLLSKAEIQRRVLEKFHIEIHSIQMVFLPVWKVRIVQKNGGEGRVLYLDASVGLPIGNFCPGPPQKRRQRRKDFS